MSGNGISIAGLGSGLDSNAIIKSLVALESLPLDALNQQKQDVQSKISTLGTFKGYVTDLQTKAKALSTKSGFLAFTVTPSEQGVATFTASGSAVAGNHSLKVLKLAQVDRWAFHGVASKSADLATAAGQQVSFDVGGTNYSLTVQQDQSSLDEIATAINGLAGSDVSAAVVNAGTTSAPSYQLVLTSAKSGEDGRISNLSSTVNGLAINYVAPDVSGAAQSTDNITVGNNAQAEVDGLLITRDTNELNDVVPGVSITATAADPTKTITFSVAADQTAIKKKVKDFVDSYNKVIGFVNSQNSYSKDAGPGGDLFGDAILDTVRSRVNSSLFSVDIGTVTADATGFSTLSLVGIKKQSDGTLLIDDTALTDKMSSNLNAFADLFVDTDGFNNGGAAENTADFYKDTTADSGLAATLDRSISRLLDTANGAGGVVLKGLFDTRTDKYNADIKRFDQEIDSKQNYIDQFQTNLVTRFANLEQLVGQLNSQGAALTAGLAGLNTG